MHGGIDGGGGIIYLIAYSCKKKQKSAKKNYEKISFQSTSDFVHSVQNLLKIF